MKGRSNFRVLFVYLHGIFSVFFMKKLILVYTIEKLEFFCDLNVDEIYPLFGVVLFHLKYVGVQFWTFRRSECYRTKIT